MNKPLPRRTIADGVVGMRYTISNNSGMGASPVWWVMDGAERVAGVHWGLHDGESSKAQKEAQKIADALNALESKA